jgi:hypothetical protein
MNESFERCIHESKADSGISNCCFLQKAHGKVAAHSLQQQMGSTILLTVCKFLIARSLASSA